MSRTPMVLPLALIALLVFAGTAPALIVPAPPSGPSLPGLLADSTGEEEEEGWEADTSEEEAEEAESEECEPEEAAECESEDEGSAEAPPECLLSSVEPAIFASGNRNQVRLQVRYTTASPTTVSVAYGLHGSKGALFLGNAKKHFGEKGVLRVSRSLTEPQMAKVLAARDFSVRIRALKAPGWCKSFFEHRLTLRRTTPSGVSWQQRS